MRKIFFFLLPAVMLFAAGCKDKNGADDVNALTVNPELITCPATGGDYEITVSSPNGAWTATPSESWIRVTPTSGEQGSATIRVKISVNKESVASKGSIVFKSGEETVELPVTRAAKAAPYLRIVSEKELNTPKEGGSYTIQVESNIKWSISSNAGWAKVNKGVTVNNDNITITVDAATMPQETMAAIVVKPYGEGYEAGSDTVIITRGSTDATSLVVAPTEINAPADGGSFTIGVSSNAKWRVYKTWDMDWLTLTGSQEGDGNGFFTISVSSATSMDDMSGIITIEEDRSDNYKPVKVEVAVRRKGKEAASLSVFPTSISAPMEGGNYPVVIKSNYPWTATTSGNFFSISSTSGDGDANMVVSIPLASKDHDMSGYILIKSSFGNETAKIMIQQEGHHLEIIPAFEGMTGNTLNVSADGGKYSFKVRSSGGLDWIATSSNRYVARVEYVQQGNYKAGFWLHVYSPTDRYDDATAQITIKEGEVSKTINVVRESKGTSQYAAKPFSVSSTKQVYFSHGNLQYQASSNTWRFAKEQYDYIYGTNFGTVKNADNTLTSPSYNGWIDLYGWGTGNNPTLLSENAADYSQFTDWGSNPIQDKNGATSGSNVWRTMSKDEWEFLLETRSNAANLKGIGGILFTEPRMWDRDGYMYGIILLPDNWVCPNGLSFDPDHTNEYTLSEWRQMEKAGAVFLPYTGERRAKDQSIWINAAIDYWTSSIEGSTGEVYRVDVTIDKGQIDLRSYSNQYSGYAVRLIRDAN